MWIMSAYLTCASVSAAAPLTVHVAVLSDPADGEDGAASAAAVASLLRSSGAYDTVAPPLFEGRVGTPPGALFTRCWNDVGCWRDAGRTAGVEQLVLVEHVDAHTLGLRVVDVVGDGPIRKATATAAHGRPEPDLVDEVFFGPGSLTVRGLPAAAEVILDGQTRWVPDGALHLDAVAAGKHTLDVSAPGHAPWFASVLVFPDQRTEIESGLSPLDRPPLRTGRWTTWWTGAVLTLGAAGVIVAQQGAAPAVRR